jgi:hypothetical protein
MQLVPVDEPSGRGVPDLGIVLPGVPEPADHLDEIGGLVQTPGGLPLDLRRAEVLDPEEGGLPPTEQGVLPGRESWARQPARPRLT